MYFLYILQSQASSRYYVGQTQDLNVRVSYRLAGLPISPVKS